MHLKLVICSECFEKGVVALGDPCFDQMHRFVPPEPLGSVGDDKKGGGPLTGKCDRFTFACGGPPIDLDVDGDLERVYQGTGDRIGDRAAGAYLEEQIEVTVR